MHHSHDQQPTRPRSFLQQLLLPDCLDVNILAFGLHHVLGHALLNLVLQCVIYIELIEDLTDPLSPKVGIKYCDEPLSNVY